MNGAAERSSDPQALPFEAPFSSSGKPVPVGNLRSEILVVQPAQNAPF
jgi:hypothetical protein